MKSSALQTLDVIAQTLYDKKGFNILVLDVRGISTLTDYFLIAEGNIDRHVKSLAQNIIDALSREKSLNPFHTEGVSDGDWAVIDYGEIVIHLFKPDLREKYALEEVWREAKIVDVTIKLDKTRGQ